MYIGETIKQGIEDDGNEMRPRSLGGTADLGQYDLTVTHRLSRTLSAARGRNGCLKSTEVLVSAAKDQLQQQAYSRTASLTYFEVISTRNKPCAQESPGSCMATSAPCYVQLEDMGTREGMARFAGSHENGLTYIECLRSRHTGQAKGNTLSHHGSSPHHRLQKKWERARRWQ